MFKAKHILQKDVGYMNKNEQNYPELKIASYADLADEILLFWKENKVFEKSVQSRKNSKPFTFYEGPPSANGKPGIHHVMARTIKDLFCRFWTLNGYQVQRKGGWDTHGLPIELQVENELGITKDDIGKSISIKEYNKKCKSSVMTYKSLWDDLTEKMGYWVDLNNPYVTFENKYIESLWHLLKMLYDKKLLYKGYTVQPYSPAAGTGLSSHELNQPGCYKDVKDTTVTAQFRIKNKENTYLLAWTTTPWTLPANSALAVGKKINYVTVKTYNQYTFEPINVILAEDRLNAYFNEKQKNASFSDYKKGDKIIPFEIINTCKGSTLIGEEYEQLMPYIKLPNPAFTIVEDDFVNTEDGTGIVHMARAFGSDDDRVCKKNNIPGIFIFDEKGQQLPIVDKKGRFVKEITDFAGMPVKNYDEEDEKDPNYKSTDVRIVIMLKEQNKAFKVEKYEHSYPHCWRTDKPILYYPLESWFIKTTAYKDRLVELNKTINWKPATVGEGRFGNWLENLVDWNLSRSRFWGTPLPIWRTVDGKEEKCIGSIEELKAESQKAIDNGIETVKIEDGFDLHRPDIDNVVLCSSNGLPMYRETDLIDVWFDSGAMPYAQWHYPFENKAIFEQTFPADFIAEGVDQTRGWFFTLHALSVLLFDKIAYKNVVSNGLVLDKDGNKMSKRMGNTVDPFTVFKKYGPDATRWYMVANANPWDNLKFNTDKILEHQKRFFGTLLNLYNFFTLYANLDKFDYRVYPMQESRCTEDDLWILSTLNTCIEKVEKHYCNYEPTKVARTIESFVVDDLSNWYVRLNRKRFWLSKLDENKMTAFSVLHHCLTNITIIASPIIPFFTDKMYQNLHNYDDKMPISVHLADFPVVNHAFINNQLEEKIKLAQQLSSLAHSIRKNHRIKVRQPLNKLFFPAINEKTSEIISQISEQIKTEVNVKNIETIPHDSPLLKKKAKPNFKKLGSIHGKEMNIIAEKIADLDSKQILKLVQNEPVDIEVNNKTVTLQYDDVEIIPVNVPGFAVASSGNITVALDISIDDALKKEGVAREIVNRVQNIRKEKGYEIQDKVNLTLASENSLGQTAIQEYEKYIAKEVQAAQITTKDYNSIAKLKDVENISFDDLNFCYHIEINSILNKE